MQRLKNYLKEMIRILKREWPVTPGEFDLATLPGLLGKDDPVILDIGCNDGSHTLEFLGLFQRARVYAFEPDPRALEGFRHKVNDERAKLFDLAISDSDGTTKFYVSGGLPSPEWEKLRPSGWDLSGSIKKPKEHLALHPWCTFGEPITIQTKKLDTWRSEESVTQIDFIWADVQGAEENLIRGGREALRHTRYLYTEYSNRELYEGQIGLRKIRNLLPDFDVLYRFENDVLLKNKKKCASSR
jgi:FkbM family methyltransferase